MVKRRPEYWFQARRRFFLKSHGKLYTALADAAFLPGLRDLAAAAADPAQAGHGPTALAGRCVPPQRLSHGIRAQGCGEPAHAGEGCCSGWACGNYSFTALSSGTPDEVGDVGYERNLIINQTYDEQSWCCRDRSE